jgi:hypothetical protein
MAEQPQPQQQPQKDAAAGQEARRMNTYVS